jgi:hypothetical protein
MPKARTKRIFVRVSKEEHQILSAKAKAAGITVSALVRNHIESVRIYNHADKERWLRTMCAFESTTAALARAAAELSSIDAVVTIAYLAAIHRHLNNLPQQPTHHACEVFPSRNRNE